MAKIEQYSRIINHGITTAGTTFTVPTSNDHTDETWLATDLYIGEIGINLTDDKIWMRTNNGLVQIATGTSSGGSTASTAAVFVWNSPNIVIGSTYSADAVTRRSGYYTDLGTTTLRWKDLYLGGSSTGYSTINANNAILITEASDAILVSKGIVDNNAPLIVDYQAGSTTKDQQLHLNSRTSRFYGVSFENVSIGCVNATASNVTSTVMIGASDVGVNDSLNNVVHLGAGFSKKDKYSQQVIAGGSFAVRGIGDDGSLQYTDCDWTTTQNQLRTSDATTTPVASVGWTNTSTGGEVLQVKAYLIGTVIDDASKVYSAELFGAFSIDGGLTASVIGVPVLNEVSSFPTTQPVIEAQANGSGVDITITGLGSTTIQWLVTYSYQRLIKVLP